MPTIPAASAEPYSAEGAALLESGRPAAAVEALRHAVAAGEPSGVDLLARAYLEDGDWHAAVDLLGPLVAQGQLRFAGMLGTALAAIGHREPAERALRTAFDSGEMSSANDLAILLCEEDRASEAAQVLTTAADAGEPYAAANLVELHLESGDLHGAARLAQHYLDEALPETVLAMAEVLARQGHPDRAEQQFRTACRLGALRGHTGYGLFLQHARDDWAGAEREFREAQRLREPGWAYTLGRFLLDSGRLEAARRFLQLAADRGDGTAADILTDLDGDPTDD